MKVVALETVKEFVDKLDHSSQADIKLLILLLQEKGHQLSMPYTKPIGRGLWELRRTGRPQIRILYGFCEGNPVLVLGLKKQRSALRQGDVVRALKLLRTYC